MQLDVWTRIACRGGMRRRAREEFRAKTGCVARNRRFEQLASLLKRRIAALPSRRVHPLVKGTRMVFDFARCYGKAAGGEKTIELTDGQGASVRCVAGDFDVVAGFGIRGAFGDGHVEKAESSAALHDARDFADSDDRIGKMVDAVTGDHDVEGLVAKRHLESIAPRRRKIGDVVCGGIVARAGKHGGCQVEATDPANPPRENAGERSRAAGDVECALASGGSDEAKEMFGLSAPIGEREIGEDARGACESVAHEVHLFLLVELPGILLAGIAMRVHWTRIQRAR